VEEIRPGDVIWFAPGEEHWHGATATTAVTHIAIQEHLDGETGQEACFTSKTADWMNNTRLGAKSMYKPKAYSAADGFSQF